jgi:hypothetical protein
VWLHGKGGHVGYDQRMQDGGQGGLKQWRC